MQANAAEAPEDWSGSVDMSNEDLASRWQPVIRDWQSEAESADKDLSQIADAE
jgi:hypothetical protein